MAHAEAASVYPSLESRSVKNTICLFDVDGTLTPARGVRVADHLYLHLLNTAVVCLAGDAATALRPTP